MFPSGPDPPRDLLVIIKEEDQDTLEPPKETSFEMKEEPTDQQV